ncbi:hypothetical protein MTP04_18110 [Lysinibacillus sp. PLM2]|nr:hypothetical protein MTP04_18110 [Lysinibacillus sp. PLM2]
MYVTIKDFLHEWNREALLTEKVLKDLTDESLKQKVYSEGRTLGRIAWHLTTTIPDYLAEFGLNIDELENKEKVPTSASDIYRIFKTISAVAAKTLEVQWTDDDLKKVQIAFGREESNAQILMGLIKHIIHHRGQITVLMRQAGIKPFGVYGPPKEDWVHLGVENPPL